MRKTLVALSVATLAATTLPGCAAVTQWWQSFENDPVAQVQTFEAATQVAINAAELAWPAILPTIPAANQAQAVLQFNNAVTAIDDAEQALNDGVNVAVIAKTSNPNFTALMQAVSDAVSQVTAIVDLYSGTTVPVVAAGDAGTAASTPAAIAIKAPAAAGNVMTLHKAKASLSRWGVKVK
jgi:hypothetical protein